MRSDLHTSRLRRAQVAALVLAALAVPALCLTPLAEFNVTRYQGHWYEIAAMPGAFRNQCQRDVQVDYVPEDGGALVIRNHCRRPDGGLLESEGRGRALDPDVPSVLKVTFVRALGIWWYPFGRNQTVIAAGPGERWLVIGDPTLRYGRVIAREPVLDGKALRAIDATLAAEGYDRCAFLLRPQAGGKDQPRRLCEEVQAP